MIACVDAPGLNTSATPRRLSSSTSSAGIVPPTVTRTSPASCSRQQLDDPRHERHVRAGEDREADRVGVLLDDRRDDLLGGLVQAGVDDLHARVAQRPGDDLRAPVVTVEAGLGDHDADLLLGARRPWKRRGILDGDPAARVRMGRRAPMAINAAVLELCGRAARTPRRAAA